MRESALLIVALGSGCLFSTSDDVPFRAADAGGIDASIPYDAAETEDVRKPREDVASADVAADAGYDFDSPDLSSGGVCPDAPTPDGIPTCNPVTRDGCAAAEMCDIGIDTATQPPTFFYECRIPRAGELVGGTAGDSCSGTAPCRWGHLCSRGTCRAYCQFEDGLGCLASEQCDVFFPTDQITHIGVCVSACGELDGG